jgi:hydrogenase nickel incorporation protein HypB
MSAEPRLVEVRRNVLKQNDVVARALREQFRQAGVLVVSLVSSPGAGKTTFQERLSLCCTRTAASRRWSATSPPKMTPPRWRAAWLPSARSSLALSVILKPPWCKTPCKVETCDLGEDLRLVLLSVTEGEDKPLKYPTIFNSADVAIITQMDVAAAVEFDEQAACRNIRAVRPGMPVLKLSSKTGDGIQTFLDFLGERRTRFRTAAEAAAWTAT